MNANKKQYEVFKNKQNIWEKFERNNIGRNASTQVQMQDDIIKWKLNPKVFLVRERGLKAGFSVSPSPYSSCPVPLYSYLPASYRPPISPFPLASITIDYPHFLLRAFCNSGCRRIRRLCCVALSISSGKSNYTEDKTDRTATAGICYGREYMDGRAFWERNPG